MAAGDDGPLALVMGDVDMVRALGVAGIPCAFFGFADDAARFSRHVRVALPWIDQWQRQEDIVAALLDLARSVAEPPVLFPQTDATLLLASRHRERLGAAWRLMLADAELVEQLVDKARFQALAERHALPVPRSQRLRPSPSRARRRGRPTRAPARPSTSATPTRSPPGGPASPQSAPSCSPSG
jgi:predicted ATP-grasp superfamily ATP-dependent carboligase